MHHEVCGFEHLHNHTIFSVLDGFSFPEECADKWRNHGDYLCISDHGMMAAIPRQIKACESGEKKLKPIFAAELYVNPLQIEYNNEKEFKDYQKTLDPEQLKKLRKSYHLLAIAYSEEGYSNLVTLSSLAWTKGHYYRPRVNHEQLMKYKEGIIFTSCCYASEVGQAFDKGGEDAAFAVIEKYMAMFGMNYVLEYMLLDFVKQKPYNVFIMKAFDKYKLPIILTNDCFVVDTQITTDVGPKSIQDIAVGDNVLTHQGRYRPVMFKNERHLNKNEIVYRVVAELGSYCFEATGNHPVLLSNGKWKKVENLKSGDEIIISKPPKKEEVNELFIDLLDLLPLALSRSHYNNKRHAFITGRRNVVCIPRFLPVDNDLLFVLGMYIAEGHVYANAEVGFASHVKEIKEREILERYFLKFGIHVNHDLRGENGRVTRFSSVIFKSIFEILCGKGANNKHLPHLKLSNAQLVILLKAYIAGDGHLRKTRFRNLMIPTTSIKLIEQIRGIICSWGIPVVRTERNYFKNPPRHKNKNAKPSQWKTLYVINLGGKKLRNFEECLNLNFDIDKFKFTTSIKSVSPICYNSKVYNLQVFEDETYTANGFVVHNCHFTHAGDSKYQRLMLMIQTKKTVQDIEKLIQEEGGQDLFELQDTNLWMKTEDELNEKWEKDYSDVIDYDIFKQSKAYTVEICRKAGNVNLDRSIKLPIIPDANEKLKDLAIEGFKRLNLPQTREYGDRLKEELALIFRKNFSSYFLIAKQIIDEARRFYRQLTGSYNATGFGRGSGVSSLVCYCIGATNVDPIKHGLLFSRFLSEARDDMPDLDLDFVEAPREHVKKVWIKDHFGQDYVSNIGSYNTFGIKNGLIDCAKVYSKDRNEILNITTKIGLKDSDGKDFTLDTAIETYPELRKYCEDNPEVTEASKKLMHRIRSMGVHAGGVIISNKAINKFIPLVRNKEGEIVSSWTEGLHDQELSPMGFVKYDLLIITNLEKINYTCELIKNRYNLPNVWCKDGIEDWTDDGFIDDKQALEMANNGDLKGIFQFDSDGIRHLVKKGGVDNFGDLVAYTAIYRPATLQMKLDDLYVKRKKGQEPYDVHPALSNVVGDTYGIMLYQEQVAKVLNVVGGIPLKDCELLRKAISKKKISYFALYQIQFIENGQKLLGKTSEEMQELWSQVEAFSGYGFNKAHATSYTVISSILLWLKSHYPLEFYTGLLHFETDAEKIKEYRLDAHRHDIIIRPLDLNKSKCKFDITDNEIYFGFANVKGIGEVVAQKIVDNQPYSGFHDFLVRFGTDESVIKPLIGLRMFEGEPIKLYAHYKWFKDIKDKLKARDSRFKDNCEANVELARTFGLEVKEYTDMLDLSDSRKEVQALIVKHQRMVLNYRKKDAIKIEESTYCAALLDGTVKSFEIDERLVALFSSLEECEMQFYGFLWHHPICKSPDYEGKRTFDIYKEKGLQQGYVEVMINSVTKLISKKNTNYWLIKAEDANGESAQIQVWEDDWERFKDDLKAGQYVKMEVKAPDKGFYRYTLYSPPKWLRHKLVPKTRVADMRVWVLRKPELSE